MAKTNRWILGQRLVRRGYSVMDIMPVILDYPSGGIQSLTTRLHDHVHPGQAGAFYMGSILAGLIRVLESEGVQWLDNDPLNEWSATNDYGNLVPNCVLAGTAGSKGSGVTGSVATGWTVSYLPSASGTSAVCSKEAHPNVAGLDRQLLAISGTPSADFQLILSQSKSTSSGAAQYAKGKTIEIFGEIEVVGGSGLVGVSLEIRTSTSTTLSSDGEAWSTTATNPSALQIPSGDWKGVFKTAPIVLPTGATSLIPCVVITAMTGVPVSGTIKVGRIGFRQVPS
jgi:hypothetical protein